MKCANCGSELRDGCLYCSNCGKEAQIVPDYNVFEDEYLKTILELENQKKETASVSRKTYQTQKGKKTSGKRKKAALIGMITVVLILIAESRSLTL